MGRHTRLLKGCTAVSTPPQALPCWAVLWPRHRPDARGSPTCRPRQSAFTGGRKVPVCCCDGGSTSLWNAVGPALPRPPLAAARWSTAAGGSSPCTQHALLRLCLCSCSPLCVLEKAPRPHPHPNRGNSCLSFFNTQLAQAPAPLAPRATPSPLAGHCRTSIFPSTWKDRVQLYR